jgi:hypothetical protein
VIGLSYTPYSGINGQDEKLTCGATNRNGRISYEKEKRATAISDTVKNNFIGPPAK